MIQVSKKDKTESTESLLRRFSRKVQQSGLILHAKSVQTFEKPLSKRERRRKAIVRASRKKVEKPLRPVKFGPR
jgi:ribosomal protein S21